MNTSSSDRGRILIVDDNDKVLDLLVDLLTEEGYEVSAASDGTRALGLAVSFAPDVVLSDVVMPELCWRVCGGIAHGDLWATRTMTTMVELGPVGPGVARFQINANLETLKLATLTAVVICRTGFELYDQRITAPQFGTERHRRVFNSERRRHLPARAIAYSGNCIPGQGASRTPPSFGSGWRWSARFHHTSSGIPSGYAVQSCSVPSQSPRSSGEIQCTHAMHCGSGRLVMIQRTSA